MNDTGSRPSEPPETSLGGSAVLSFPTAALPADLALQQFVPLIARSKVLCEEPACLEKRARVGVHHGAFLYELHWGVVEAGGLYIPGVSLRTRCPRCGKYHDRIEMPHASGVTPEVTAR